jgi:5-formyltetrahydrofolate cyclo-ligase
LNGLEKRITKEELRKIFRQKIADVSPEERAEKSKKACDNLISTEQFQKASVIMFYLAMPQEIDTADAVTAAWQQKKTVVVPKIYWDKNKMIGVRINSFDDGFTTEVAGLRNPKNNDEVPPESIDLIIVPGLAFDHRGMRLGRGGGYYDKFLADKKLKAKKCGFCFAEQLSREDNLPVTKNDIDLDMLVTDKEVIDFN